MGARTPPRPQRSLGELRGRPHDAVFFPDGRWVAVAGQDKVRAHVWSLDDGKTAPDHLRTGVQHTEQVKALAAWPTTAMIASGGDDSTVRLWTLDEKTHKGTLLGTLVAVPAEPQDEAAGLNRRSAARPGPTGWRSPPTASTTARSKAIGW